VNKEVLTEVEASNNSKEGKEPEWAHSTSTNDREWCDKSSGMLHVHIACRTLLLLLEGLV